MTQIKRGNYNEILQSTLTASAKKQVTNLVYSASNAEKIDEHGGWNFGISDFGNRKKGGWLALNWDLYGIGRDYFSKRTLIVIQVRQSFKRKSSYWTEIKKSYFLIGRNEDNTVFAHPVESRVVQAAAKAEKNVVLAVQNWIFGQDYTKIIRQGDIGLLSINRLNLAHSEKISNQFTIQDSHLLKAEEARMIATNIYVKNPSLYHLPKTHPNFENLQGWYRVIEGKRSDFYSFATPTID